MSQGDQSLETIDMAKSADVSPMKQPYMIQGN